jgi:uncharacterized protein YndB with AHSA1/START domain
LEKQTAMPTAIDVTYERAFSGTARRIFELLTAMGTAEDRVWPFPSQPFMRSAGPLKPGATEEWHGPIHAVLEDVEPEKRIVWRIDSPGVEGTHAFELHAEGRKVIVRHRLTATLSDTDGRVVWKRYEEPHQRAIEGLFDKLARVLKR